MMVLLAGKFIFCLKSQLAIEPKELSWLVVASIDFPVGFDLRAPGENQETRLGTWQVPTILLLNDIKRD